MLTVLVPCVSSSTTAMRWAGPLLVVPQAERPRATRVRVRGAKRRIDGANTFVSSFLLGTRRRHSGGKSLTAVKQGIKKAFHGRIRSVSEPGATAGDLQTCKQRPA